MDEKINKLMEALEKNNMQAFYAENKEEALKITQSLLPEGATVTHGGSVTLQECGVMELLKSGVYNYLDRTKPGISREEIDAVHRGAFSADVYLTSSNAVTEDGMLYNVDGNCNRVAAILYGPKSVVCLVGKNKIVKDLNGAADRVRLIAAPKNTKRLNCPTYCREEGHCMASPGSPIGEGCGSDGRICCGYVVSAKQRQKNRIKVIIINEDLGY